MASKLSEIITQYSTFEDNQVLTKNQLNELINYFEVQDRLSRILLSGVGIVCGFKLKFNSTLNTISISLGTGVTTDGDLLLLKNNIPESKLKSFILDEIIYTNYRKFEDNSAFYRFFKAQKNIDGKEIVPPIELIEILPPNTESSQPLSDLQGLKDKVVLLYLESYSKELKPCTSIDCNNQGKEQVAKLRVLLISKTDAAHIERDDSIFTKHDTIDAYYNLPDVAIQRVVLNPVNTANYSNLKIAYYKALTSKNLMSNLKLGTESIIANFKLVLGFNNLDDILLTLENIAQSIIKLNQFNLPLNIQYRYDFIKDIIDTYNEIRSLLLSLKEECCPNIKAFPKHLLLGNLDEVDEPIKHNRHSFYKSPILYCESSKIDQCRSLVFRLFEMIKSFNSSQTVDIKITPSNKLVPLSFRSIPFYYEVQNKLLETWNYFKTEKLEQGTNLSYHTSLLSNLPHIKKPLKYNLDKFDFYRIEGHQGMDYRKAIELIDQLKTDNGLAFDVKVLSVDVNNDNLNIDDYLCEFEDLYLLLRAWTAEQECILAQVSSFFSAFSTAKPGINIKEPEYSIEIIPATIVAESINMTARKADKAMVASEVNVANTKITKNAIDTVVSDSLTTDDNTLGFIMQVVLTENKGYPIEDIIAKTKYLVENKVTTGEWIGKTDIKTFVIDQSIELMATIHVLTQQMPQSIIEMTNTGLTSYKLTIDKLCALVKKLKARYESLELSNSLKTFMGLLVNQLSSVCCSSKKLDILEEEINKRKERILTGLKLSAFVEKNPGLEHIAGVQPGGTFVMVYINNAESVLNEEIVTSETNISEIFNAITDYKAENTTKEIDAIPKLKIEELNVERSEFVKNTTTENVKKPVDFGRVASSISIPKYTVVADFSLPYMCCSNCSSVNFIIQKPTVSLQLDKETFCLGKDTSPLLFDVSPEDGIIKGNPEVVGMSIDGNKLSFDPATFPNEMLGKPIHFNVNDQVTQTEITVCRQIECDFNVPESPTTLTTISFNPTIDLSGAIFLWNFGDGNTSTEKNPTHQFTPPEKEDITLIVSLTVSGPTGYCTSTVEHEIVFTLPVNNCVEETKAAILLDLNTLTELDWAESKIVHETWLKTSELYGGTANYKNGVINDVDNYLTGNYNNKLDTLFINLLNSTFNQFIALNPDKDQKEYNLMAQLLRLQIQLFYNILGCQDNNSIEKYLKVIQNILSWIIETLQKLKESKVELPRAFIVFMKEYVIRVSQKKLLKEHFDIIANENLI